VVDGARARDRERVVGLAHEFVGGEADARGGSAGELAA
jgi:hypothetical protein